ncbi:hypothetical protein RT99_15575 [Flavobacterium sp. MEB061]|uniref:hypothetical protein n=1 Tax=Flavobacterium sp. MEB061 TaxID=1587524 RepID=UPI0005ABC8BD|nr:hypothetical protein [Flavobacterium sp. MEB061]KIQ19157.1 hypothetical protein RT99_15575 [Flavobacterium sp. MEB061]
MIKKFLLLSLVASQLMISCSSDDSSETTDPVVTDPTKELTLEEEIALIVKQPYSSLTPAQQKVKLEAEANEMLVQLDKTKNLSAIETIENLNRLLDISPVDIFNEKNGNGVEDILQVSGVYGIYTWNNTEKIWVKTTSSTELKFVFPAKESQTTNNAALSAKSISSDIKVDFTDTSGHWYYDNDINEYVNVPGVYDKIFLPTSADATLTIDNTAVATFTQTAKYSNGKETPNEFAYKMTLSDGYTWEMSGVKAVKNTSKATLTYNGKNLLSFNSGSTADIDALITNDELVQYRGKANGLVQILDNFVILADTDLATSATDDATLDKTVVYPKDPEYNDPNANFKAYYTAVNTYRQKYSAGTAANFNKNSKLILVSKKDGTKIADIVVHSEKSTDSYTFYLPEWYAYGDGTGFWQSTDEGEQFTEAYYDEVYYLKFNDNTEVEMSVYFSEGFSSFEAKFEEFIKAFEN